MAGLLCERGLYADAVALEEVWNELLVEVDAALHGGYAANQGEAAQAAKRYLELYPTGFAAAEAQQLVDGDATPERP